MRIKISSKQWNNLGFKRMAEEDWYTEEVAKNTKDPNILAKILRRGKDDQVSYYAVKNSNCSPEILTKVLRRGKDDIISWNAAKNPNCPPEALDEVLRKGEDNNVSWHAARNPNASPDVLEEILMKGVKNLVSLHASQNPNCPLKAKFEWLEATNQLTKYDPEKFELEHDEEDKDLEELRKLMG